MNSLKVTIIQSILHWENVDENLILFSEKINAIKEKTDIIVLPEMFTTGFSMNTKQLAETMEGKTVSWMKNKSSESNSVIVGSIIIKDSVDNAYYNRLVWMQPDGIYFTYDKRHLFRMANEDQYFKSGKERLIINYKGWRICPLTCYDLRFPAWSRNIPLSIDYQKNTTTTNQAENAYDCLIYIANWPSTRSDHWSKLLEARAIENQAYVVGVNRVGMDEKENDYSGDSVVIHPKGYAISKIAPHQESISTIEISLEELTAYRDKFPLQLDSDRFNLTS